MTTLSIKSKKTKDEQNTSNGTTVEAEISHSKQFDKQEKRHEQIKDASQILHDMACMLIDRCKLQFKVA